MSYDPEPDKLVERIRTAAAEFPYPPTPDIAATLRRRAPARRPGRLLTRLALAVALLIGLLLFVPEVRAAAARLLQIGVVRLRILPPPPTALPSLPTPAPVDLGLTGEIPVDEAAERFNYPLLLPAYPADLGPPDRAFLQTMVGETLVLVWLDPADPSRARLSLHMLSEKIIAEKTLYNTEQTTILSETRVGGSPAFWVHGPHLLEVFRPDGSNLELHNVVAGNTLIWTQGELTYRLECELPLEEAIRIAESLR